MTRMSEPRGAKAAASSCNQLQSWSGPLLARPVHGPGAPGGLFLMLSPRSVLSLSSLLMLVGCVIPPSLTTEQDAGVNAPPAILAVSSDQQALSEPGPVLFNIGAAAGDLSVSLIDTDVLDTLYVRIFVDYNSPNRLDARSKCTAPPNMTPVRTATCPLNSLCFMEDVGVQRNMTIMVFDRPPDDSGAGDPPFQAMSSGGLSTSRFYFLKCQT